VSTYEAKYPKATECLTKDRDVLLTFYDLGVTRIPLRRISPI
jgi:putative transposase